MDKRIDVLLGFLKEIEQFKHVKRNLVYADGRNENDAEHVWQLLMFLFVFEKDLPESFDLLRAMKIGLVHDLPEVYTGDVCAFDASGKIGKDEREMVAAEKLFSLLPADLKKKWMGLYVEYREQSSHEAKIVKAFDKLQPMIQVICSKKYSYEKGEITWEQIDKNKLPYLMGDDLLIEIYHKLKKEFMVLGFP